MYPDIEEHWKEFAKRAIVSSNELKERNQRIEEKLSFDILPLINLIQARAYKLTPEGG